MKLIQRIQFIPLKKLAYKSSNGISDTHSIFSNDFYMKRSKNRLSCDYPSECTLSQKINKITLYALKFPHDLIPGWTTIPVPINQTAFSSSGSLAITSLTWINN